MLGHNSKDKLIVRSLFTQSLHDDAMGTYLRPATLQKADMVLDLLEGNEETASQELKWKDLLRSAEKTF